MSNNNLSDSFELLGDESMSLKLFTNIVCMIPAGERFKLRYEHQHIIVYGASGLILGLFDKGKKKKELIDKLINREKVYAICSYNDSWYGDQKGIKFFNISVDWEVGEGEVSRRLEIEKKKEERKLIMERKSSLSELKKTDSEKSLEGYVSLMKEIKEFNEKAISYGIDTYIIKSPLIDLVKIASKLEKDELVKELLANYFEDKSLFTENQVNTLNKYL